MTESDKQDPVLEARELLSKATPEPLTLIRYEHGGGRLWCEDTRDLIADFYDEGSRDIVSSLCNELETLRSQHSVQADSIKALHEQEKKMKAALLGVQNRMGCWCVTPFVNISEGREHEPRCKAVYAVLTPKGEQK